MQSLMGFEAAARLQSFSRAAEELAMTQSAISHQVRSLEEQVGQVLFRRQGRRVELTDAGRDFLETTRRTLETLGTGMTRLDFYTKPGSVVVTAPPAWCRYWLLPRLPALREVHPDIDPWIVSAESPVEFEHNEVDCFFALGDGHWPGLECVAIAPHLLTPVCSPTYRKQLGRSPKPAQLLDCELLHDESWEGWSRWFEAAGLDVDAPVRGSNFSDPGLALEAAIAGQGVALASTMFAAAAISDKKLVRPFRQEVDVGLSWYLLGEPRRIQGDAEARFWAWMADQAAS